MTDAVKIEPVGAQFRYKRALRPEHHNDWLPYNPKHWTPEDKYETRLIYGPDAMDLIKELKAALEWYGEQARLARLIHSEGDAGRHALAHDGGKRARALISKDAP